MRKFSKSECAIIIIAFIVQYIWWAIKYTYKGIVFVFKEFLHIFRWMRYGY